MNFMWLYPNMLRTYPIYLNSWFYQPTLAVEKIQQKIVTQSVQIKIQSSSVTDEAVQQQIKKPMTTKKPQSKKSRSMKKRQLKAKKRKDFSYSGKSQKENRNNISIVSRMFLRYIKQHPNVKLVLDPTIKNSGFNFTSEQFQSEFELIFDLSKNYIRQQLMQDVINQNNCRYEFSVVFRTLLRKFLKSNVFPTIFTHSKLNKKVKRKELKFVRQAFILFFKNKFDNQLIIDQDSQKPKKSLQAMQKN